MSMMQNVVTQVLAYINAIGGYNVFEWRTTPLNNNELPAIIVRDPLESTDEDDDELHNLQIEIVIVQSGETSPASIRTSMEAVLTAFKAIESYSGIIGAVYTGSEKDSDHLKKKVTAVYMTFEVFYKTERWEI